jgi:hypothetical protein
MPALLMKIRPVRRFWYLVQYMIPCIQITFSKDGLGNAEGRQQIWGKWRRLFLGLIPGVAQSLQRKYGLSGGCVSCGASCKLLFQCVHWDDSSHLCSIYDDRPMACRLYPITPADIDDRNLVLKTKPCGFQFINNPKPTPLPVR